MKLFGGKIQNILNNGGLEDGEQSITILTDTLIVDLILDNYQNCCEDFGILTTEDDESRFIGAKLLDIRLVVCEDGDPLLKSFPISYLDEGRLVFVNLYTDRGMLQYAIYNCHNGYYGHLGKVTVRDRAKPFEAFAYLEQKYYL